MQHDWMGKPAWQLRGMATDPDFRGAGVGTRLLAHAEAALAKRSDFRQIWCNARSAAVGFYRKQGWTVVSDEFQIPGVGPHYKMTKTLAKVICGIC
jgi:GNAT superfamily N-acetyltransferase